MYVVVVFLEARPEHKLAMRQALEVYARTVRQEPACRRYDISIDPVDPASFLLYQIYDDRAAHERHRELQHYSDFHILIEPWTRSRRVLTYDLLQTAH